MSAWDKHKNERTKTMKITKLTTYSVHTTQFRNFSFVRVDTDEGYTRSR